MMGLIASLQLIGQMLIQVAVVRAVGFGGEADVFFAAQTIPLLLMAILSSSLQSVWLPRFSVFADNFSELSSLRASAQGQALMLGGILFLILSLSVSFWIPLAFPGFDSLQQNQTALFSLVFLIINLLNVQASILTVELRATSKFLISEFSPMLITMTVVILLFLYLPSLGLVFAVAVILIRAVLTYVFLSFLTGWAAPSLIQGWGRRGEWQMLWPLLAGTSVYKTMPIVDRYWASFAPAGGISSLNMAQSIVGAVVAVFEKMFCVPVTPQFSRYIALKQYDSIRRLYRKTLIKIALLTLLASLFLFLFSNQLAFFLKVLMHIDLEHSVKLVTMSQFLLGYLFAAVSGIVLVAVFYALGDSKTPVLIGLIGFFIGIILKWKFFSIIGLNGLVATTSVYLMVNVVMFYICLERRLFRMSEV